MIYFLFIFNFLFPLINEPILVVDIVVCCVEALSLVGVGGSLFATELFLSEELIVPLNAGADPGISGKGLRMYKDVLFALLIVSHYA